MAFKLKVDGVNHPLDENKTLLENLELQGLPAEFQCREGYCGACRVTKLDGQVVYPEQPIAFIRDTEILPCCCRATSDLTVVI